MAGGAGGGVDAAARPFRSASTRCRAPALRTSRQRNGGRPPFPACARCATSSTRPRCRRARHYRRRRSRPRSESWIRARLAQEPLHIDTTLRRALAGDYDSRSPRSSRPPKYRPFRPVLLWGERARRPQAADAATTTRRRARRRRLARAPRKPRTPSGQKSDQTERTDSLLLYRFESHAVVRRLHEPQSRMSTTRTRTAPRKAAQDAEQNRRRRSTARSRKPVSNSISTSRRRTATARRSPAIFVYPEWDWKKGNLDPDQARILENFAERGAGGAFARRPRKKRGSKPRGDSFETLRPRRRDAVAAVAGQ